MSTAPSIKEDLMQQQILQAAKQLFRRYGLYKVTMDDVAKAIGKGRSSLYYYYKSREEILDAVMDAEMKEVLDEMGQAVDQADTVEEKIYAFCLTKLRIVKKRRAIYNGMETGMDAAELSDYTKAKNNMHLRFLKKQGVLLKRILTEAIGKGELPDPGTKELDNLVFVILSSLYGLKREMIIENSFNRIEAASRTLSRMIVHGIGK